jgi:hypothetical protein
VGREAVPLLPDADSHYECDSALSERRN